MTFEGGLVANKGCHGVADGEDPMGDPQRAYLKVADNGHPRAPWVVFSFPILIYIFSFNSFFIFQILKIYFSFNKGIRPPGCK